MTGCAPSAEPAWVGLVPAVAASVTGHGAVPAARVLGAVPAAAVAAHAAASGAAGAVAGGSPGGLLGLGAGAVFDAAGQWVAAGATWFLRQLVSVVSATTAPPITSAWFTGRLGVMTAIGAVLALPLTLCAVVQAIVRQSPGMVVRIAAVNLPVALTLTGMAVTVVHLGLSITDTLSSDILATSGTSASGALSPLAGAFGSVTASGAPSFALLLGAVVVAVAALGLWLEMAIRSAAVSVAVLFLPLVMAAFVWPAVSHWCRRLADTLAALILSKLVIVGALGLATAALGNGLGGQLDKGGFGALVTGAALLVVASAAPFILLRLIPAVEAGAVAQLETARGHLRHAMGAPKRAANLVTDLASGQRPGGSGDEPPGPVGPLNGTSGLGGPPGGPGSSGGPGPSGGPGTVVSTNAGSGPSASAGRSASVERSTSPGTAGVAGAGPGPVGAGSGLAGGAPGAGSGMWGGGSGRAGSIEGSGPLAPASGHGGGADALVITSPSDELMARYQRDLATGVPMSTLLDGGVGNAAPGSVPAGSWTGDGGSGAPGVGAPGTPALGGPPSGGEAVDVRPGAPARGAGPEGLGGTGGTGGTERNGGR